MKIIHDSVSSGIESVDLRRCSVFLLYSGDCVYSAVLNSVSSTFVFSGKCLIEEPSDLIELHGKFDIDINDARKILVFFHSVDSVVVSKKKYEQALKNNIANIFLGFVKDSMIFTDEVYESQVTNIYGVNKSDYTLLSNIKNKNISFCHYNSMVLKLTCLKYSQFYNRSNYFARIFFDHQILTVVVYHEKKLIYLNNFNFVSIEDNVYNILNIINSLEVDKEHLYMFLNSFEDIQFQNSFVSLLSRYFAFMEIEHRPLAYNYEGSVDKTIPTFLAPLFELALCEL